MENVGKSNETEDIIQTCSLVIEIGLTYSIEDQSALLCSTGTLSAYRTHKKELEAQTQELEPEQIETQARKNAGVKRK